jgi:uncharacterized protein YbjT (DUF2867 family)
VGARTLLEDGHEGKEYDLTGSEALTYAEVATLFTEVLIRPIRYLVTSTAGQSATREGQGTLRARC